MIPKTPFFQSTPVQVELKARTGHKCYSECIYAGLKEENSTTLNSIFNRDRKLDPAAVKVFLEQVVDEHAKAKVDRIVSCVFGLPWGTAPPGFRSLLSEADYHGGGELFCGGQCIASEAGGHQA